MDLDTFTTRDSQGRPMLSGAATLPPMLPRQATKAAGGNGKAPTSEPQSAKRKTANRFGILNGFVDCSMARLSRVDLGTWLVLYRDTRNGTACTAQSDIAKRIGASDRAVRTAINKLIKLGLLVCVWQGGLNRGPSRYRVESLRKPAS